MPNLKPARDVQRGERIAISGGGRQTEVTVVSIEESFMTIRNTVLMFTLQRADGSILHRQFYPRTTIRMLPNPEGGST